MMNRKLCVRLLAAVAALSLAACSSDQEPVSRLPTRDSEALGAQHSRFEGANDPPFTAETHHAAGRLAESQNAYARAIEAYELALKVDKAHLPSLYRLGIIYTQLKQYPHAIDAWQRYRDAAADDPAGYANLGFCYELAGLNKNAELIYRKAIVRWPEYPPVRINYGLMLARTNRLGEAIVHLSAVLPPARVQYNLGSMYEQQGRRDLAKAAYRKALDLDPTCDARARLAAME